MGRGRSKLGGGGGPANTVSRGGAASGPFKKFATTTEDEWDYAGDGDDTIDFFKKNSNYSELIDEMDEDEREAFEAWCSGIMMGGTQYLGWDGMGVEAQKLTRTYDKYLDRATLDTSVELRRLATPELVLGAGHKNATLEELKAMKGRIVTSKGNMSTAAASEGLGIGSDSSKPVEYAFKIPAGSTGAGMWIGDSRINGWRAKQREFMMNRDTSFMVGKTTYDKKRGKYIVEMEYVGLGEHDYGSSGKRGRR